MSKRKNKNSRLTKTDVNTICEMQRKIDAYETYIIALSGYINKQGKDQYLVLRRDTPLDGFVSHAWETYSKQMEAFRRLKKQLEEIENPDVKFVE